MNPDSSWPPTPPPGELVVSPQVLEDRYRWSAPPPAPPRPKFQHRYRIHVILFVLTLLTTSFTPAIQFLVFAPDVANPFALFTWETFKTGLWYSLPVLTILGAHEFGHYGYCRYHNVDASLPYFLPAPVPLTGTLGAVIRIREAFPSNRALFDIGVAGPIAGFVALLPFLYFGVRLSEVAPVPPSGLWLGEPLLFKAIAHWQFGVLPPGHDIFLHPMGMAAWFGMLATALNLMPFGQLDGGHIAYAVLGRRAAYVSIATLVIAVLLTVYSQSWLAVTLMMLAMAWFLGVRHPRVIDEGAPLGPGRTAIAAVAVLIFILSFTPIPIDVFVGQ